VAFCLSSQSVHALMSSAICSRVFLTFIFSPIDFYMFFLALFMISRPFSPFTSLKKVTRKIKFVKDVPNLFIEFPWGLKVSNLFLTKMPHRSSFDSYCIRGQDIY